MMKKIGSLAVAILMLMGATVCFAADPIGVELDYAPVSFDQEPIIVGDRTMVPVRAIFEAMGAEVLWDADTKTVTSQLEDLTVRMTIDQPVITANDVAKELDTPPMIVGGRTLVPVRAVSESFGCEVEWDAANRTVQIFTQPFLERAEEMVAFGCVKQLTEGERKANVAFGLSYFTDYEVKKNTADGTDIDILYTSEKGHTSLNVRTDLFTGTDEAMTEAYVAEVAEELVTVMSGNLITADVAKIGDTDFAEIVYTAPGIMHGITDQSPTISVYIARKSGVVYTMTHAVYGEVEQAVARDFRMMLDSMLIA